MTNTPHDLGPTDLETRIDRLFALDPSEFIATRDAEAKELRAAGRGEDAATVKAFKRPTVAAWALNQVVRAQPDAIDEFLALSGELRTEQEAALSGDATKFRSLLDRRRELERALVNAAVDLLAESSSNAEQSRAELTGTLGAAAVDDGVADRVRRGRLERVIAAPSGFDLLSGMALPPAPARATPAQKGAAQKEAAPKPATPPPVDELAAKRAAAEAAREKARAAAERAERIEVAASAQQEAKTALDDARKEVRRLETELARARRAADRAEAELEQAKDAERAARRADRD